MNLLKRLVLGLRRRIPSLTQLRHRLELFNHSPVLLPWFKMRGEQGAVNRVHRLALELKSSKTRWALVKGAIVWPLFSCIRAVLVVHRYGVWVKKKYHVSLWVQWKQIVYLGNRYNLPPQLYYNFRLWKDLNRRKADLYIRMQEHTILIDWLNRNVDTERLDNKYSFYKFCQANDLPNPPMIAMFDRSGTVQWHCESSHFPKLDLFMKPANLWCGIGVERWEYAAPCHKWKHDGMVLDPTELVSYCHQRANKGQLIVNTRLYNHASIEHLSNGALCTLRVVTYRLPQKRPALLQSCFRMPVGMAAVDNFNAGGIAAGVSDNGKLGVAVGKDVRGGLVTHHPDTQARIEGEQLPYWQQMVDLALLAHERLGEPCFVGWDVALTVNGPVLIEGNDKFGVDLAQMPQDQPLGETKYGEIFIAAAIATNPEPLVKKILVAESC